MFSASDRIWGVINIDHRAEDRRAVDFSDNYPFKCPVMKFKTKIYHPNVKESSGEICDQAIKNTWVPTLNANYLIKMLKELIENPSTDAPMEADTAAVFMQDNAKFKATA